MYKCQVEVDIWVSLTSLFFLTVGSHLRSQVTIKRLMMALEWSEGSEFSDLNGLPSKY